ncbi:hypothetical protein AM500_10530 [Bacillus sp. FJAT-18017]|uniref:dynamin family protein n=1 Tax=Bacillus sp. FJAT-18017 TaxID=1705566 RepID=UPI0006B06687|nr:dynamin family protein [Bacillus sp. FJAT-18017]ALC90171.1 hypothetical protein AM500_10530 [Bacillus sp. FJAT-18017]
MVQTKYQQDSLPAIKGVLARLYLYLKEHGDTESAQKIRQLATKYEAKENVIAFCGHFSAGKSSMINKLAGADILPSSPIPTSANLVKIKSGADYAKVYFKTGMPWMYMAPYDYGVVKSHAMDGDEIDQIEISSSTITLPANGAILDTPGIDSADDAHRIATESALHLADLIFYVMDYNHVQSEVNFLFTKELTEAGKEVYLVVNQIDKHRDEELSFEAFKNSVLSSFQSWGVRPAGIFYTSLRDSLHTGNEYPQLELLAHEKLQLDEQVFEKSTRASIEKLVSQYLNKLSENQEEERTRLAEILSPVTDIDSLEQQVSKVKGQLEASSAKTELTLRDLDQHMNKILENAYLMPFETRELARLFLESTQPGFKVGLLFSTGKTNAEKTARREAFFNDVNGRAKEQVEWHIRELLQNILKENEIRDEHLHSLARNFSIGITEDLIEKPLKSGALVTGDYLLNYTDGVSSEIKRAARNAVHTFKKDLGEFLDKQVKKETSILEAEVARLSVILEAKHKLDSLDETIRKSKSDLTELLNNRPAEDLKVEVFEREDEDVRIIRGEVPLESEAKDNDDIAPAAERNEEKPNKRTVNAENVAMKLKKGAGLVVSLPGFAHLAKELGDRASRLENRAYTVALFGAFSAGKSSFANALIGETVLPVSPNPTTAAICRIKPVTAENAHGKVVIQMKESASLLDDVNRALKSYEFRADSLEEAAERISQLQSVPFNGDAAEKANLAFLNAFNTGFAEAADKLGNRLTTGYEEFKDYVAREEKSCFVEWIDLHFDCELTRKGITLVDTPGADSINARHTGVAFDYIKNADAILFVTYYNHAFSRADREFLIQLGRVKEVFELDKMFFIVNAIDLAKDEEEKQHVLSYVKGQLEAYGIRNPHLNPVSSLLGLKEKLGSLDTAESGLPQFEEDFYRFISEGLSGMAAASAEKEFQRIKGMVSKLVQSAKLDKTMTEEKIKELHKIKQDLSGLLAKQSPAGLEQRVTQEAEELVHYVKQRVFLRFGDFFKESFNPSAINANRNIKHALKAALEELLESLGHDLAQEMRATGLRIEKFTVKAILDFMAGLEEDAGGLCEGLTFGTVNLREPAGIEFPRGFVSVETSRFNRQLALFKNPKDFFEKNGKQIMQDELNTLLSVEADAYLEAESARLNEYCAKLVSDWFATMIEEASEQAEDYINGLLEVYGGSFDAEKLEAVLRQLEEIAS